MGSVAAAEMVKPGESWKAFNASVGDSAGNRGSSGTGGASLPWSAVVRMR